MKIFVHIVTFNNRDCIGICLDALLGQRSVANLEIHVTDNNSVDGTVAVLKSYEGRGVKIALKSHNLGFAAGHNEGASNFLASDSELIVILNPDLALEPEALSEIVSALNRRREFGIATGLLIRADQLLRPIEPRQVDSAGIIFTKQFRHFDRFQGRTLNELHSRGVQIHEEEIEGATGAFLALRKEVVTRLLLESPRKEALYSVYPQLREGVSERVPLFDEAFFAYREDAELAIRARLLGIRFLLVPTAIGAHERHVTPERRRIINSEINRLGVRNRFLLQADIFYFPVHWSWILGGIFFRNLVVIFGVFLVERSSISAFYDLIKLFPRALDRRRILLSRIKDLELSD